MAARKKERKKPAGDRGKRYLSRARIAARERRAARWARLKEVAGIALVVLTVAAIISLLSYHPQDRSFNAASGEEAVRNYLGSFGACLSDLLVQLFGAGAYLFPVATFLLALACFVRLFSGTLSAAVRLFGIAVFGLSAVGLVNLAFNPDPFFGPAPAGGLAGSLVGDLLIRYLHRTGGVLILAFTLLTSFMLVSGLTLARIGRGTWGMLGSLGAGLLQRRRIARGRAVKAVVRRKKSPPPGVSAEPEIVDHHPSVARPAAGKKAGRQEAFAFARTTGAFALPPLDLLEDPPHRQESLSREELLANSRILENKLQDFGVSGRVSHVHPGPVITMYEYEPAPGVKVNRIVSLSDDLALAMSALTVRVVAPIPGKSVVGIEIPNHQREMVHLKDIMLSGAFRKSRSKLAVALGKDIFGRPRASELNKMPHILIAGATGSGKSVMINAMISSILFNATPAEVQFLMIDPKMVELTTYDGIPHLIAPVVSNPKKAAYALRNAVGIMEERYRILAEMRSRNIESYNQALREGRGKATEDGPPPEPMPYLIIVIDELADLMILAQSDVEDSITRLAQLSRAVGIHLMIATQRPSTNVITGIIKANLPVRISFQVSSKIDSRVVLDANGAEQLLGKGDMLFLPPGTNRLERLHGAYVSETEVNRLVDHLKEQASPTYNEKILEAPPAEEMAESDGEEDEMYDQAVALVTGHGQASISFLQRKLRVGYNRAARMIEAMEKAGILGPADGARPRKVLVRRNYDA